MFLLQRRITHHIAHKLVAHPSPNQPIAPWATAGHSSGPLILLLLLLHIVLIIQTRGSSMLTTEKISLPGCPTRSKFLALSVFRSSLPSVSLAVYLRNTAFSFGKTIFFQLSVMHKSRSSFLMESKRTAWTIRSNADGSTSNSSSADSTSNGTRLIKAIQAIQVKFNARVKELRKNLPIKLLSFLVGFYCATAFATVIGQTGDWDILSAALAVVVVEGIGALMYRASLSLIDEVRDLITVFNYWKAGLTLGLFLDSFKY